MTLIVRPGSNLADTLEAASDEEILRALAVPSDDSIAEALLREAGERELTNAKSAVPGALAAQSARVRAAGAELAWQIVLTSAAPALLAMFNNVAEEAFVRDTAAYALGRLGYGPALAALRQAVSTESGTVRACAAGAVAEIERKRGVMWNATPSGPTNVFQNPSRPADMRTNQSTSFAATILLRP